MIRNGLPAYRKAALAAYAPICVYCGFGIKEVLEVAHLDCQPSNCSLDNLALLCPTCHRMHDLDLIPTDVVIRLRDEKRTVNWKKLMKDATEKAAATKKRSATAKKAATTRKQRASVTTSSV